MGWREEHGEKGCFCPHAYLLLLSADLVFLSCPSFMVLVQLCRCAASFCMKMVPLNSKALGIPIPLRKNHMSLSCLFTHRVSHLSFHESAVFVVPPSFSSPSTTSSPALVSFNDKEKHLYFILKTLSFPKLSVSRPACLQTFQGPPLHRKHC